MSKEFIPLEIFEPTEEDTFSTQDWLSYLEHTVLPPRPPARPISPFMPRTPAQMLNLTKLSSSLGLSLLRRKPVIWGDPLMAMIEPTSLCNLKCPLCPSGNGQLTRTRARMDLADFKTVVDKLPDSVRILQLWNQGEPFLVKDVPEMIRHAKRRNLYVVTSTNGHYFRKEDFTETVVKSGIDEIIISLDGADQAVYHSYRVGGKLQWVFEGVQRLARIRAALGRTTPRLHLQFILMDQNVHQQADMIALGRKLGADMLSFKTLQVTNFEGGADFLPQDATLTRYTGKTADNQYVTRKRRFFPEDCLRLWYSVVINCDGQVSPCCFDKDVDFPLGNLLTDDFDAIWRGPAYQAFRQHLLRSRYEYEMCQDCTEGLDKLYLYSIDYHRDKKSGIAPPAPTLAS